MQSSAARKMTAEGWLEPPPVPHHYESEENHKNALRFGMWLFLGTEVLLFAGIFVGYFVFRTYFPEAFEQAGFEYVRPKGKNHTVMRIVVKAAR